MRTVGYVAVGRTFVLVHGDDPPTDEDWDNANVHAYKMAQRGGLTGVLVHTFSTGPTAQQRARLTRLMEEGKIPIVPQAVLTESIIVRGIVTAFAWVIGPHIKTFSSRDVDKALDYLQVPAFQRRHVLDAVGRLKLMLAGGDPEQLTGMSPINERAAQMRIIRERVSGLVARAKGRP
jgi:hypothetical protein